MNKDANGIPEKLFNCSDKGLKNNIPFWYAVETRKLIESFTFPRPTVMWLINRLVVRFCTNVGQLFPIAKDVPLYSLRDLTIEQRNFKG